ncbi:MAG: hypothetical protein Ct9H90mP20_2240 [Candidatus Neomarinimicrobiota bacterium]|nr:MAG: hypothetical protein Ct9H90mP20_2240 [Candidatus Neomarinimicrobiota bacterium]
MPSSHPPALDKVKVDEEEAVGVDIMRRALDAPLRQICSNAGVEPSIVAKLFVKEKMTLVLMLDR